MLDLSEESIEENMEISAKYLKRMRAIDCFLEAGAYTRPLLGSI
jgi:fructose-bisphosphate aldolase class II